MTSSISEWVTGLLAKLNSGTFSGMGGSSGLGSTGGILSIISDAALIKKLFNDSAISFELFTSSQLIKRQLISEFLLNFWLIVSLRSDQVFFKLDLYC
jgi:hypothetical protein